jgi:hypothetical protein
VSDKKATRAKLAAAIQETIHADDSAREAEVDGSVLTGWVIVAEWSTPDDRHAITVRTGGVADQNIPWWRALGLMRYAMDLMRSDDD